MELRLSCLFEQTFPLSSALVTVSRALLHYLSYKYIFFDKHLTGRENESEKKVDNCCDIMALLKTFSSLPAVRAGGKLINFCGVDLIIYEKFNQLRCQCSIS
jgi:hypothetical protein